VSVLVPQQKGIPVPKASRRFAAYWEGCRQGRLLHLRCPQCAQSSAWHVTVCSRCGSSSPEWVEGAGRGRLYSWTVVWRPQHPAFSVPYAPAIVELDEGYHMMSAIVGCEPEQLQADMRLAVEFHAASDEIVLPYFGPEQGARDGT
jgi:uncharacterized protein